MMYAVGVHLLLPCSMPLPGRGRTKLKPSARRPSRWLLQFGGCWAALRRHLLGRVFAGRRATLLPSHDHRLAPCDAVGAKAHGRGKCPRLHPSIDCPTGQAGHGLYGRLAQERVNRCGSNQGSGLHPAVMAVARIAPHWLGVAKRGASEKPPAPPAPPSRYGFLRPNTTRTASYPSDRPFSRSAL